MSKLQDSARIVARYLLAMSSGKVEFKPKEANRWGYVGKNQDLRQPGRRGLHGK